MMNKKFRAWDGSKYWYADDNLIFSSGFKAFDLRASPFELKDVEMFIGKIDSKGTMIYENDLIKILIPHSTNLYQVIWSNNECGFRKIPYGMPFPETKIDEAFMEIVGTINSQSK